MNFTFDLNTISDLHKDARGYRPSQDFWNFLAVANPEQKQAVWDGLIEELNLANEAERRVEDLAVKTFETKIAGIMDSTLCTREHAIAMFVESMNLAEHDLMYGGERICYLLDLPYRMAKELDPIVIQILDERVEQSLKNYQPLV